MATRHRMFLITTGGTIAGQVAADKQDQGMLRTADEFTKLVTPTVAYLNRRHDIDIEVEPYALCDVDSANILPEQWIDLAALIKKRYDEFDSFLITHGTNTLGYTAAALSFALQIRTNQSSLLGPKCRRVTWF